MTRSTPRTSATGSSASATSSAARSRSCRSQNRELEQLKGLQEMNTAGGLQQYDPVTSRASTSAPRAPGTRPSRSTRAPATASTVDDPVVNGQGLVGKVKSVSDGNAVVMLLTDQDFGVSALAPRRGEPGSITPIPGAGGDLLFDLVDDAEKIRTGDLVVTAGTVVASGCRRSTRARS